MQIAPIFYANISFYCLASQLFLLLFFASLLSEINYFSCIYFWMKGMGLGRFYHEILLYKLYFFIRTKNDELLVDSNLWDCFFKNLKYCKRNDIQFYKVLPKAMCVNQTLESSAFKVKALNQAYLCNFWNIKMWKATT